MQPSRPHLHDVVIAGAGPVGLFLACELQLAGCSVLVLEKAREPRSRLKEPPFGLRGLTAPTMESLDRRGLLDELTRRAATRKTPGAPWMQQQRRPGGHFAGIQFFHDQIDTTKWRRLVGPTGLATDMASIEAVLKARSAALGVRIQCGCGVERLEVADDGVAVSAGGEIFHTPWLVGCDGARSTVRKAAGIGFTGTDPEFTGYSVLVELESPHTLRPGRHYTPAGVYTYAAPGTVAMVDFDGGAFHRTDPISRDHVEAVLRKILDADVKVKAVELATTWTDRAYQATQYRSGRILLAGDAAHIHSPLGGQGLNLGLGDAMNLGWKLAATIRGHAPRSLIDSYERERAPIGAQILDWSRAQVALMRPEPGSRALQTIIRDLIETREGATYFAERIWNIGLRYPLGGHPQLSGCSAPDFELADGTRLNEHLRNGRGLLLDFAERPALSALARSWDDRINYVASSAKDRQGLDAVLVRPDGVVAWAIGEEQEADGLAEALMRWFGRPR